jgi:hypothetical protein
MFWMCKLSARMLKQGTSEAMVALGFSEVGAGICTMSFITVTHIDLMKAWISA